MKFFISHSTKDKVHINRYVKIIEQNYQVIIDSRDFIPGEPLSQLIRDKIDESDKVIVFYSKNVAEHPKWVFDEVRYAIEIQKPFACVNLDNSEIPELITTDNEKLYFRHTDSIELIEKLVYQVAGLDFDQIKEKLGDRLIDPAEEFINHLTVDQVRFINDGKFLDLLGALSEFPKFQLLPKAVVTGYLNGSDPTASYYNDELQVLETFGIIETAESHNKFKIRDKALYDILRKANKLYSHNWKQYFLDAIAIKLKQ